MYDLFCNAKFLLELMLFTSVVSFGIQLLLLVGSQLIYNQANNFHLNE